MERKTKLKTNEEGNFLERTLKKLFYTVMEQKIVIINVDKTSEGYRYNINYEGNLSVPRILESVAQLQGSAIEALEINKSEHITAIKKFEIYERDLFGIKRLRKILSY